MTVLAFLFSSLPHNFRIIDIVAYVRSRSITGCQALLAFIDIVTLRTTRPEPFYRVFSIARHQCHANFSPLADSSAKLLSQAPSVKDTALHDTIPMPHRPQSSAHSSIVIYLLKSLSTTFSFFPHYSGHSSFVSYAHTMQL